MKFCKDLDLALDEYPDMERYIGTFQIKFASKRCVRPLIRRLSLKEQIVVFKKKKRVVLLSFTNHSAPKSNSENVEIKRTLGRKVGSCLRCRKFKKKCSRLLPECLNCVLCDEICVYPSSTFPEPTLEAAIEECKRELDESPEQAPMPMPQGRRCSDLYRLLN